MACVIEAFFGNVFILSVFNVRNIRITVKQDFQVEYTCWNLIDI